MFLTSDVHVSNSTYTHSNLIIMARLYKIFKGQVLIPGDVQLINMDACNVFQFLTFTCLRMLEVVSSKALNS